MFDKILIQLSPLKSLKERHSLKRISEQKCFWIQSVKKSVNNFFHSWKGAEGFLMRTNSQIFWWIRFGKILRLWHFCSWAVSRVLFAGSGSGSRLTRFGRLSSPTRLTGPKKPAHGSGCWSLFVSVPFFYWIIKNLKKMCNLICSDWKAVANEEEELAWEVRKIQEPVLDCHQEH